MIRYEFRILLSKRINRLILAALLILAFVFSVFAIWSVDYVDESGIVHNGLTAPRKLTDAKSEYKGVLTTDVIQDVLRKDKSVKSEYGGSVPNTVYAENEQKYSDIKDMAVSILCYDKDFDYASVDSLTLSEAGRIYNVRDDNIDRIIKEYGDTEVKKNYIKEQYSKVSVPFEYAPAVSWQTMGLYATTYAMILLIVNSFLAAGIFSEEFRLQADTVFFSTKLGRRKGTLSKIAAGLIMVTVVYWGAMLILSVISFGVMGISGAESPIQIEYSYCMYAYSFMQAYMTILLAGYIGNILAAVTAMLVSAKSHSAILAMCVPFLLFIVSPFIGRVLPFKEFFNITPDQLVNVYNCIRLQLVYQFGETAVMQIPMLIVLYSCVAVILIPCTYRIFSRYSVR